MKKIQVIIAFVLIVVIVGTTVGYQIICAKTEDTEEINEHSGKEAEVTTEEDSETFSCEGTTGMGVTSQLPAFSVSAAVMYVEEVYFSKIPFDFNLQCVTEYRNAPFDAWKEFRRSKRT